MNGLVPRTTRVQTYSSQYVGYKKKHNVKKYLGLCLIFLAIAIYFKG